MKKENILITNLKSSISFLKKHSKFAGDLAEGQLQLLLDTGATDAQLRAFGKDLDSANDVWRQSRGQGGKMNEKSKLFH